MNPSGSQLTGLQFELAMAIGSSLDLEAMLGGALEILLRRLDVSAAAVHARKPAGTRLVLAVPRSARVEPPRPWPGEGTLGSACRTEALEAGGHRHEFELPGFGILTLDRRGPALEGAVLRALEPLMQRLGRAARACVDHAAVLASEARFATLVASVPEVIFEGRIETRGQLTLDYVSPRAREVLGHEAHDLVAQPGRLLERIVPADRESLTSALAVAAASETPFEHLVRIDDGGPRPRWLQIAAKPDDRMSGVCRWSGLIQDVTARQQLAATEREVASLRTSALLSAVDDAIVGSDASGRITHWNRGAERMLGYRASAAIGQRLELIMPERMHALHAQAMAHHLATGDERVVGRPVELPARHADGHEIPVELVLSRVEDQGDIFFVGILRDVTARRLIEQEQARAVSEERRLAAAFLELGRSAFQDLRGFERRLTEVVAAALGVARVSLWTLGPDQITCDDLFEPAPGRHSSGTVLEERVFPSYFEALRNEPSIVAADASTHRATACFRESYLAPLGIVSMLDVPIRTLEGTRGVLCVEATERRNWRPSEVRFCLEVSGLLAQATERLTRLRVEARHEVVLSSIGDAVIACDLHQRITLVNPLAEQLTGWSRQEAFGRPLTEVFQLLSPETLEVIDSLVPMTLSTGRPQGRNRPALLAQRNDERTPVADSVSPIIEDGEIRGAVLAFRDVREEEAARRALERQNRRLRSLGEAIPDLLFSVSLDGRLQYMQESSNPNLAVDPAAISEQTVRSLFPPDLAETILGAVAQTVLSGEVQVVEYNLNAVHGEQWFEARLARMSDQEAMVLVRNVSLERTRARSLHEERERLAAVLATTSAIIYAASLPDFTIEYVSESASAVLGFPNEAFKRPGFWESAVHPEDLSRVQSGLSGLFASGRLIHEYRHRHADGSYRWLRDEVRLVPGEDGRPARAVGASFDITDRKVSDSRLAALFTVQQIVSRAAAGFLGSRRAEEGDVFFQEALAGVGRHTNADRAYMFRAEGGLLSNTHEWCADGVTAQRELLQGIPETEYGFFMDPIRQGSPLFIESVAALPPEARAEQELLASQGIETLLAVPLMIEGNLHGFVGLDNLRVEPLHPTEFASLLQLLADTLAAGLQRVSNKQALNQLNERLMRKTEQQQGLLELSTDMLRSGAQAELFEMMQGRLRAVLGVDRVSLFERIPGTVRFRLRLLDLDPDLPAGMSDFVNPRRLETDLLAAELEGSAPMEAMRRGAPVTTREHRVADFPDWQHLHKWQGHDQFVVVPLVCRQGVFGTLNVGFTRPEPPTLEEVDWVSQFSSMLSAHLSMHEARDALQALNLELESRVEARTRELRASEERFERLFQQAPQAMLIIDGSRRVVQSNRNAQHLFGRGEDEFGGTPINELVPEPVRELHSHLMDGFIREGEARPMAVGRLVQALRRDGTIFAAEIGLVPIDLNGETHILAGVSDINARHEAQKALTDSLREKETLLKEIHHRVKNNLQIISSLLMLQRERMPSDQARQLLEESVLRVRSMALIHQQLYGMGSFERIDLGDYARQLAEFLRSALAPLARLRVDAAVVEVNVETAVPLGLILNELLTNALKYGLRPRGAVPGASPGRTGEHDVLVEISLEGEQLRVAVLDSGDGIPEDVVSNATSLGLHLVRALNRQIRGKLAIDVDRGSRVVLTCPRPTVRKG